VNGTSTDARAVRARADALGLPDDEFRDDRDAAIVWSTLVEPGDRVAGAAIAQWGARGALDRARRGDAEGGRLVGDAVWSAALRRWGPRWDAATLRDTVELAARAGAGLLTPVDAGWPRSLGDLGAHAPVALWVRGDASALAAEPSIAIVGARAATAYGEAAAAEVAGDLAARGVIIVSGAAWGIDGVAHRAAFGVGGRTVAVLAGGVDKVYPSGHTELIEAAMAAGGAVAAEVPCGAAPTKWRFLQRNRLIAALGAATVVVEAGWRSGSLNTAGHASALGRPLGAVPGPITSPASAGCHRLLRDYDAVCITCADDALALVGIDAGLASGAGVDAARTDDATRVRDALSTRAPRTVGDIARRAGMDPSDVAVILGYALLAGDAVDRGEGWLRVT